MYTQQIKIGRILSLLGYFSLMAGIYSWHLIINDTEKHLISIILILQIGPLLFPLKGLLDGKVYTHAWSMYLAIYYFVVGVWYSAAENSLFFGLFIIFTSLLFFAGTALYTRYSGKMMQQDFEETE